MGDDDIAFRGARYALPGGCVITAPAVIVVAASLFALYAAGAWMMLRSVSKPALGAVAWTVALTAIIAHFDALVYMMRSLGPFSIGLLEATSMLAWMLAILACL